MKVHKTRGDTNTHKTPCIIAEEDSDKVCVQGQMACNRKHQKFKKLSGPKIVSLFN